jgi:hypothetical protein
MAPDLRRCVERVTGIEPAFSAWEADVLPLNYTREDRKNLARRLVGALRAETKVVPSTPNVSNRAVTVVQASWSVRRSVRRRHHQALRLGRGPAWRLV